MSKRRTRRIAGVEVDVIEPGKWRAGSVLVCMALTTPLLLPDNCVGECATCARAVQWGTIAPKGLRTLCMECASNEVGAGMGRIAVTDAIADRVEAELRRRRH